jgi:uncharacterized membrane protein YhaH (DUF805 family)
MTSVLLVLLSLAALGASLAVLAASLGLVLLADVLAAAAALGGLAAFVLVAAFTVRRARQLGKVVRP